MSAIEREKVRDVLNVSRRHVYVLLLRRPSLMYVIPEQAFGDSDGRNHFAQLVERKGKRCSRSRSFSTGNGQLRVCSLRPMRQRAHSNDPASIRRSDRPDSAVDRRSGRQPRHRAISPC
jgi:hypothetical protein